jgi:NADH dehydrogenase
VKVLILGGGYGGIFAASNLSRNKRLQVTLVNDGPGHQILQKIHLVASGELQSSETTLDISTALGKDVKYIQGRCKKIDLITKEAEIVILSKADLIQTIQFDTVIIAIGAKNEYFGIKGARENTLSLRSVRDALYLHTRLRRLPPNSVLTIAGGGATGISLAGALSERFGKKITIRVVEAQNEILPGWDSIIIKKTRDYLTKNNVEIISGNSIKEIDRKSITLSSGQTLQTDVTVWTAGIRGQDLIITPNVRRTKSARIVVDKFSQVSRSNNGDEVFDNVFAIGDISAFSLDSEGKLSPQLAQFAVRQARNVAKNIVARVNGVKMTELEYIQKGQIISLGNNCIGILNGFPISGGLCENTEDFVIDNYIKAILNRGEGLEGMIYDTNSLRTGVATSITFFVYLCRKLL